LATAGGDRRHSEDFMRAESVREGDKIVPLSKSEDEEILKKHSHAVIYQ
jgi:hypothetical protein